MCEGTPQPLIYVVDDDTEFARSLSLLLTSNGYRARYFACGDVFLEAVKDLSEPTIALLDVQMPKRSGLEILDERPQGLPLEFVIMTGHGDIPLAVRAIQKGAAEFIEKPFSEDKLFAALQSAAAELGKRVREASARKERAERLAQLTAREKDVFQHVVDGLNSRSIAQRLGLSVRTVEMHRANLVRRLGVRTMAEAIALAVEPGRSG